MLRYFALAGILLPFFACTAQAQVLADLKTDWSNVNNPNGPWTYREGTNALPAVASWQSSLGGWGTAQPGWAKSENGNDRLPFWFQSNGSETFTHDFLVGDIVVHSTDTANGVGSGPGNVIWTSTITGSVAISGGTWIGRDIGRSNTWSLWKNNTQLTDGIISSGDAFDRANPFLFANGSGGASAISNISVAPGDTLMFMVSTTGAGDFTGVNFTISAVPEPSTFLLIGVGAAAVAVPCYRRWRRKSKAWISQTRVA